MYLIKYEENNNIITYYKKFKSNEEADVYLSDNLKDKEAWIEEIEDINGGLRENINLTTFINNWIYLYSEKKKTFYSYGKLIKCTKFYVEFQTKEENDDLLLSHITIATINNLISNKKAYFSKDGGFVNLKEYM